MTRWELVLGGLVKVLMKEGLILLKLLAKYLFDQPTHFLAQMSDNPVQNLFKSVSVVSE